VFCTVGTSPGELYTTVTRCGQERPFPALFSSELVCLVVDDQEIKKPVVHRPDLVCFLLFLTEEGLLAYVAVISKWRLYSKTAESW